MNSVRQSLTGDIRQIPDRASSSGACLIKPYFSFQWHITDECDQRCKHCYIYSSGKHTCLKSMTWEEMENTFYNCLDFCKVYGMTPYFYITGGDPILHPDFWRLLDLCHEHNIKFTILGNPFHLNDQVCRELKWYGCEKYQLSLDGLRETHDWFRKPGSFDCTLEKIGCLNRAGIRSVIMTTVSKTNRMEIPGIIDEVVKAGANIFAFSRYVPSGGDLDASMAAHSIGVDSCIISVATDYFFDEFGQSVLKKWDIPEDFHISAQVILGYHAGEYPAPKERRYQEPLFV